VIPSNPEPSLKAKSELRMILVEIEPYRLVCTDLISNPSTAPTNTPDAFNGGRFERLSDSIQARSKIFSRTHLNDQFEMQTSICSMNRNVQLIS
jgi:hypothetical protein